MRSWLKKFFSENRSIYFIEAENRDKAIDMYKFNSSDSVLIDITMPKLNGVEALKEITGIDSKAKVINKNYHTFVFSITPKVK
jgi:two-component system chemotaxis response regulator CheY